MGAKGIVRGAAVGVAWLAALLAAAPANAQIAPGERQVKVLIGKWSDQAEYPFTVDQVRDTVFEPVAGDPAGNGAENASGFFGALTGGATSLVGAAEIEQVTSSFASTDAPVTGCQPTVLEDDLRAQAGVSLDGFDHVIHVVPRISCPGSGFADIPGKRVFLNGSVIWRLVAHELTHNLGADHAGACTAMAANGDCNPDSYGDPFDIMGASTGSLAGFPSAVHQVEIGLLSPDTAQLVTADGVRELAASNGPAQGSRPQTLAIERGPGAAWPYLALETRVRRPYDDFLDPGSRAYNGVTVHLAGPRINSASTALVPASPGSSPGTDARTWPLARCEVYTDPASGASVRPLSVGGQVAQVEIALGGRPLPERPECAQSGPPGGGAAGDDRVESARLRAKKTQRQRGKRIAIKVEVSAGEQATVRVGGTVKAQKKRYRLKPKRAELSAGESAKLTLKPKGKKAKRRIAKALRAKRKGRVIAKLEGEFTDTAGNKASKRARVTLR